MLTTLPGLEVTRAIPYSTWINLLTGASKVYGGVIRETATGRIVAHLVERAGPAAAAGALGGPVALAVTAVGTVVNDLQLFKLRKDLGELRDTAAALQAATSQIIKLSQGALVVSGLTFAVAAAGFLFLTHRLNRIDKRLDEISKNVKAIKSFLESQEKAALATALKTLSGLDLLKDDKTRVPLLIDARQRLGEIHERHRDQLLHVTDIAQVYAFEEYFSVTALGHALCSAELDMHQGAANDVAEAFATWRTAIRRVSRELILGDNPERFLASAFSSQVRTEELIEWLDFAHSTEKGLEWVDELRSRSTPLRLPNLRVSEAERDSLNLMRKFTARNWIFEGYASQYRYLEAEKLRPSEVRKYLESLPPESAVGGCHVLVAQDASS